MRLRCVVNGVERVADDCWAGESLLHVLRERMGLTGSKNACEQGECGSCTVLLDGAPVCACLVAAGQARDREITTVEGLARLDPGSADPIGSDTDCSARGAALGLVGRAFLAAGAVQCGFCTPGFVVAVHDLLTRQTDPSTGSIDEGDVREALAGNLCRCTGYEAILDAVRAAAAEAR